MTTDRKIKHKVYIVMSAKEGVMAEFNSRKKAEEYVMELYRVLAHGGHYYIKTKED